MEIEDLFPDVDLRPRRRWAFALGTIVLVAAPIAAVAFASPHAGDPLGLLAAEAVAATAPAIPAAAPEPVAVEVAPAPAPERVPVTLVDLNRNKTLTLELPRDGAVDEETAATLEHFFRCRRTGRHRPIAQRTLAMLADLAARYPGHEIEVISGVRAPPYGAKHSKHFSGHAIDLRVRGVSLTEVRDYVWVTHRDVGVGWYPGRFIHMDHRPDKGDTAWTGAHEPSNNRYRPRWAERARAAAEP